MRYKMNILYCGDSNIVDGLIISILSLIKHEKGNLNIYVFSMDYDDKKSVSEKAIKKLDKLVKEVNKDSFVKLIDVEKFFLEEMPTSNIDTLFTPYCMLRLYADFFRSDGQSGKFGLYRFVINLQRRFRTGNVPPLF